MLNISIRPGALCIVVDCTSEVAVEAVLNAHRHKGTCRFFRDKGSELCSGQKKIMSFDDYGEKTVIQCNRVDSTEARKIFQWLREGGAK